MAKENRKYQRKNGMQYINFLLIVLCVSLLILIYTMVLIRIFDNNMLENMVTECSTRTDAMNQGVSEMLEAEDFSDINDSADMDTQRYQKLQGKLNEIRDLNSIRYFYTAKRGADGKLIYLVDGLDQDAEDFRKPGDYIEDEMIPYIERSLNGETVYSQHIIDTTWGHIFTSCYPVMDDSGNIIGALCIEMDMEQTYQFIKEKRIVFHIVASVASLILIILTCGVCLYIQHTRIQDRKTHEVLKESNKKLEDTLADANKKTEIISSLATLYSTIYSADLGTRRYEKIDSDDSMDGVIFAGDSGFVDAVVDKMVERIVVPEMKEEMREFLNFDTLADRLKGKTSVRLEYKNKKGEWMIARFIVKNRDETGEVKKVLYVLRNITEEKNHELEMQEKLKEIAKEARRANNSKSAFLSRMSHDIRTPINGIMGLLNIDMAHFDDQELVKENHKKMMVSANYLLSLINDVLQMSKLEDGSIVLTHEHIGLMELTQDIVTIIIGRAVEAGIEWDYEKGKSKIPHPYIYGSPVHLRQIFLNIYGNCIKYNHFGGKITTIVDTLEEHDNICTYRWTISDTGVGMSEEFLEHIFDPFVQEKNDARSVYQGTGLGMAIVKGLLDEMGGTIEVTSKEGVGSTFVITIPFEIAPPPEVEVHPSSSEENRIEGLRLMLVEDNELNAEIAEILLTDQRASVTTVRDGKQAVDLFKSSPAGSYDVILMDVMMPVMDGLTATEEIRAMDREDAKVIPIIAMTANAFEEDAKKCIAAGMNAHLAKPLEIEKVKRVIREQLEVSQRGKNE